MVLVAGGYCYCFEACRLNKYDGVKEYWVCVREHAQHTESLEKEETSRSREKAPVIFKIFTYHLKAQTNF